MTDWYELSEMTSVEFAAAREKIRVALARPNSMAQTWPWARIS